MHHRSHDQGESVSTGFCIWGGGGQTPPPIHGILRDTVNKWAVRLHSCYSCKSLAVPRVEDGSYLIEKTRLSFSPLGRMLWLVYTEHQCQFCNVASDITLIKLLRFLNKSGESLQQWVATPIDQMCCVDADAPNQSLMLNVCSQNFSPSFAPFNGPFFAAH